MKKTILVALAIVLSMGIAVAGESEGRTASSGPRAIGINLGYGANFSYQHAAGPKNMWSIDVGLPAFNGIAANITYDWINPFNASFPATGLNWYLGIGAGFGWQWGHVIIENGSVSTSRRSSTFYHIGLDVRLGIEYNFSFPLQLSLSWCPSFGPSISNSSTVVYNTTTVRHISFYNNGLYAGCLALGVRYHF